MKVNIKTPLLRICIQFLRLLGFQLGFSQLTTFTEYSTLLLNVILNLLITYQFFCNDPFLMELDIQQFSSMPFFSLMYRFNGSLNYALTYLLTMIYYFLYARHLIELLDSAEFQEMHTYPGKRTFALLFLLISLFFAIGYFSMILRYLSNFTFLPLAINWFGIYINYLYIILPLGVAHYITLGTYLQMKRISGQVKCRSMFTVFKQIKACTQLSGRLHRLNSFPMAAYLVSNSINTLNSICLIGIGGQYSYLAFISGMYLYPLYLTYLARQSQVQLQRIVDYYKGTLDPQASVPPEKVQQYTAALSTKQQLVVKDNARKYSQSCAIKLGEFTFYEKELQLRVFTICTLDYTFFAGLALFLLNYMVFILQTN